MKKYAQYIRDISITEKPQYAGGRIISIEEIGNYSSCDSIKDTGENSEFYNYFYIYKAQVKYYNWFGLPSDKEEYVSYRCNIGETHNFY